ncbi:hypothetical protein K438DRAFT_1773363 [Mycena galopus ATCC 62051]|nr:hypothetical protein K438DRAFT_1773363 [Mycena galopus ATCC 62051]
MQGTYVRETPGGFVRMASCHPQGINKYLISNNFDQVSGPNTSNLGRSESNPAHTYAKFVFVVCFRDQFRFDYIRKHWQCTLQGIPGRFAAQEHRSAMASTELFPQQRDTLRFGNRYSRPVQGHGTELLGSRITLNYQSFQAPRSSQARDLRRQCSTSEESKGKDVSFDSRRNRGQRSITAVWLKKVDKESWWILGSRTEKPQRKWSKHTQTHWKTAVFSTAVTLNGQMGALLWSKCEADNAHCARGYGGVSKPSMFLSRPRKPGVWEGDTSGVVLTYPATYRATGKRIRCPFLIAFDLCCSEFICTSNVGV